MPIFFDYGQHCVEKGMGHVAAGSAQRWRFSSNPNRHLRYFCRLLFPADPRAGPKFEAFQAAGEPVISIDAKKKELLGEFKNGGSDYGPQGEPIEVNAHDFEDKQLGKVVPYGVYDIGANLGYVSLGIDHDTGEFAVNAVRCWLDQMGWKLYPGMRRLMITADGGGSNGSRLRLWKLALQQLADETGLIIQVCHYPPGTSKWNKIEHRMFCHITQRTGARRHSSASSSSSN